MFNREKKPDTLKQKRTRQYVRILLGMYLLYTSYNMGRDFKLGVVADNPVMVLVSAILFAVFGTALCVTAFLRAMKISAEELREKEHQSKKTIDVLIETERVSEFRNAYVKDGEGKKGEL